MAPPRSHKRHAGSSDLWLLLEYWPLTALVGVMALAATGYAIVVVIILVRSVARLVKRIAGHARVQIMSRRDVERELFRHELPVRQRPVHNLSRTTDEQIRNPQGRSDSSVARAGDLPRLPLRVYIPADQPTSARYVDTSECVVCTERKPQAGNFPTRRITMACDHDPHVCLECLERSIQSNLQGRFWDQISCPECSQRLQRDDVRDFATTEIFKRYLSICHI